ncbi:cytochrome b/b6 domain-containing protein [Rhodobacter sp. 24-YEA-8]|uniref:cytochrome b/b6 domain-containing protein n=1 Tax=Rhodobacter sp. 24-YEA-8 TaxID=1884310 RepID=UPI000895ED1D|nr:cytochrome b/b6 domain-containing protein [Rhodobacter sp. 24-YEA-8]SEB59082.1 Cytochrome b561 [Rhodobacter sp. 24-YEA-8]
MQARNTVASYGRVSRIFHWLTAALIITTFPLGLIAENLPYATSEELALKAQLFSIHKTLGVTVFFVALARILWALTETRPAPVHPGRKLETFAAEAVHWSLYISLVLVPLTGWIHHAAVDGFAPILWPFGQNLPFVPKSETIGQVFGAAHGLFVWILLASLVLHIAGALKHVIIDRDETLARMVKGTPSMAGHPHQARAPVLAALLLWAAAGFAAWEISRPATTLPNTAVASAPTPDTQSQPVSPADTGANTWQVESGSLALSVQQMGSAVAGQFATWSADIAFEETPTDGRNGTVTVKIDTRSLSLGSVSDQAKGADFFDVANHPGATFTATIRPEGTAYIAEGTLDLRGQVKPVSLPFSLTITGDTAVMKGETTIDRRDFGMGTSFGDESQVGFPVLVTIELTAKRQN